MIKHKLKEAPIDHPGRCPSKGDRGEPQCVFFGISQMTKDMGGDEVRELLDIELDDDELLAIGNCPKHAMLHSHVRKHKMRYAAEQWQMQLAQFEQSGEAKCLRSEIAVLRLTLQSILQIAQDKQTLVVYASQIMGLTKALESLISTTDRLEMRMNLYIDKTAAIKLASEILDVISEHVPDPDIRKDIGSTIAEKVQSL